MRAYSIDNVIAKTFNTLDFTGHWLESVGKPELTGAWFIFGPPKNGKTSFAMKAIKYLSNFKRVAYNSIEEGVSLSIQMAMQRENMQEVGSRVILLDKEPIPELIKRLAKHKSPDVVVIDSIQFAELKFSEYKALKSRFPTKLFIYISHVEGKLPEGNVARRIWRDSNVYFRVEGFRSFPVSRYGGGEYMNVNDELAANYWGLKNTKL